MLHGIEGILQEPRFHFYLLVPGVIFFFDRLITLRLVIIHISHYDSSYPPRRAKSEVPVLSFRLLQSDVTELRMYRISYICAIYNSYD